MANLVEAPYSVRRISRVPQQYAESYTPVVLSQNVTTATRKPFHKPAVGSLEHGHRPDSAGATDENAGDS